MTNSMETLSFHFTPDNNYQKVQSHWAKHKNPSSIIGKTIDVSHMFNLNETELLILFHDKFRLVSICSYNIFNDNYTTLFDSFYLEKLNKVWYCTASLDNSKSLLYLFGENGKIVTINLETKTCEQSSQSYHDGSCSRSLFINKQFHIFGGWCGHDKYHFIWNEKKK
eukprot:403689_1